MNYASFPVPSSGKPKDSSGFRTLDDEKCAVSAPYYTWRADTPSSSSSRSVLLCTGRRQQPAGSRYLNRALFDIWCLGTAMRIPSRRHRFKEEKGILLH